MRKGTLSILVALVMISSAWFGLLLVAPAEGSDGEFQPVEIENNEGFEIQGSHNGHFTRNDGQWSSGFDYVGMTDFGSMGLSDQGAFMNVVMDFQEMEEGEAPLVTGHILRLSFENSGPLDPVGQNEIITKYNYLISEESNWVTDVPNFEEVLYEDVWNGIDLKYRYEDEALKYDFIVRPHVSPENIRITMDGQENMRIDNGDLVIDLDGETTIKDTGLQAFYLDDPDQKIDVSFRLVDEDTYTFDLGDYDPSRTIVIDPLYFSTLIGNYASDYAYGVGSDDDNNYYIAGYTYYSSQGNFPTTTGAYQTSMRGTSADGFVSKFHHSGGALIWSTFIGGYSSDYIRGMTADGDGNVYVTGYVYYSSTGTWPTTSGAYRRSFTYNNYPETMCTKIASTGSSLSFSTLIGGAYYDYGYGVAVDDDGYPYISGYTGYSSTYTPRYGDYPATSGVFQTSRSGTSYDAFCTKFNTGGTALDWSTYIGGTSSEYCYDMDLDDNGNAYLIGYTYSSNFPTTSGAYDTVRSGTDVFVTKLSASSGGGVYSTFLGGTSSDYGRGIAVDSSGNAYVTGYTYSSNFPVTSGAYDTVRSGTDAYVTKFNAAGSALSYSTFLGGTGSDYGEYHGIDVTSNGEAWVTGRTYSTNFPTTSGAWDTSRGGSMDGFLTNISSNGGSLGYSTYFGGSNYEYPYGGVVCDKNNNALVGGYTSSSNFPTTVGAYQRTYRSYDAILVKIGNPFADPQGPTIDDNSDTAGYAGRTLDFDADVEDNVGVMEVTVEYWFGTGTHTNHSFNAWGPYEHTIGVPNSLDSLNYFYSARDSTGLWTTQSTQTVPITDIDAPTLTSLNTPAGYTGDPFFFSLGITDNIDGPNIAGASIEWTYNYDWANSRTPALTYDPSSQLWNSTVFTVQMNSLDPITFNFTARDTTGNTLTQGPYVVPVLDNDPPTILTDSTPLAATTGDPHNFTITAEDNILIPRPDAFLSVRYPGGYTLGNMPMVNVGDGNYYLVRDTPHLLPSMEYSITVIDTGGYSATSPWTTISITDNDPPEIFSDMSPSVARAGQEDYPFRVMVTDNIQLTDVTLEYWFSFDNEHKFETMDILSPDLYYFLLDLPTSSGTLHYKYFTADTPAGLTTETDVIDVVILDTTLPTMADITYDMEATTGDQYDITLTVTDDVDLSYVRMHYNFGEDLPEMMEGVKSGDTFSFSLDIPHSLDMLYFWFEASDLTENVIASELYSVPVIDNDMPEFVADMSDTSGTTGDSVMLSVQASDNIDVGMIMADYIMPGGEWTSVEMMSDDDETFTYEVMLLNNMTGDLSYYFLIYDTSMNMIQTDQEDIGVTDDELPMAMIEGPETAYQFEVVDFTAAGSYDNVGIVTYIWEINGESLSGSEVNYTFDTVGEYTIELKVSDGVNPTVSYSYNITILDAEAPVIVLEIPEEVGNHLVFSADASGSTDNVGVTIFNWLMVLPDHTRVTGSEEVFEYDLEGILGEATLYLSIADAMGNTDTAVYMFSILDLMAPTAIAPEDVTVLEGTYLTFQDDQSYDNIGITEWLWHISFGDLQEDREEDTFGFLFAVDGIYNITLTVYDSHGNNATDFFHVTVDPIDPNTDSDGDGMPDLWEEENGLDKNVDDSRRDYDNDFLTNFQEFELGTHPKDDDTDNDGLPDKFEYDHAYDPGKTDLVGGVPRWMSDFDGADDPDEDGDTSLEEYLEGNRDPLVADAPEEKKDDTMFYIIIALIIIILVAIIIIALIILFGKVRPVEEEFPEGQYPHLYKNVETPDQGPANPPT